MKFGLDETILKKISDIFGKYPQIKRAAIFGSRATGTYKNNSDIDIAVFGEIDYQTLLRAKQQLEQLPTPYTFDLKSYKSITHKPLTEHIDQFGKTIYEKD